MTLVSNDDIRAWVERLREGDDAGVLAVIAALDGQEARAAVARLVAILGAWSLAQDNRMAELQPILRELADVVPASRAAELARCLRRAAYGAGGLVRVLHELDTPRGPTKPR
jgi:hypothetical protein